MPAPSTTNVSGMPYADFVGDSARSEQHVARTLPVRVQKQHDQADEQDGVDERDADDEPDLQAAVRSERLDSRAR